MQKCINFVEKRRKFSHFEGSIIPCLSLIKICAFPHVTRLQRLLLIINLKVRILILKAIDST